MTERKERIAELMLKYLKKDLSAVEHAELDDWITSSPSNRALFEKLTNEDDFHEEVRELYRYKVEAWKQISNSIATQKLVSVRRIWVRWVAAASIIFVMAAGAYIIMQKKSHGIRTESSPLSKKGDIHAPNANLATVTLDDGTKLYLNSLDKGPIALKGNVELVKLGDGQLSYRSRGTVQDATGNLFNTLTNPRGSKVIEMTLSDGSHVWLNSESSIRYPVAFTGGQRVVEISGEAYFEVAHDASRPFHVKNKGVDIAVLGTHFNINAYEDETAIRVTLLQGSVAVSSHNSSIRIKPGDQAVISGNIEVINGVDIEEVMAWKNGRFEFNNSTVQAVMRQLSRWYDVDIEYVGSRPDIHFIGSISRTGNVSEVLHMLEQTKAIRFQIKGRTIQVMK